MLSFAFARRRRSTGVPARINEGGVTLSAALASRML
jgi:hypothetical protein